MNATATKLRTLASSIQPKIDHAFSNHRQTNTPRRWRQAQKVRLEGLRLQRTQKALNALATHHEQATITPVLAAITSKAKVYDLVRTKIKSSGGYYDARIDTGEPFVTTPEAQALWSIIEMSSQFEKDAMLLKSDIERLRFTQIAGYFPTPKAIVERMLAVADIKSGMTVLEPSAGSGNILDGIRAAEPGAVLTCFEVSHALSGTLKRKGYDVVGSDFMEMEAFPIFDRVLMNPPFEKGQEMEHVRHAFDMLKPNGLLVAIMSPGPFMRKDAKSVAFSEWFDNEDGEITRLPENSFKESGTGVATVLVAIRN